MTYSIPLIFSISNRGRRRLNTCLSKGLSEFRKHNDRLVSVFVSHQQTNRNREVHEALTTSGVHIALRSGKLRFSPHLYNTDESVVRRYQAFDSRVGSIP